MIRVALVSYLNTKPFLDGLEAEFSQDEIELNLLTPAACAQAMSSGSCDLALLPVGSLVDFYGLDILNSFCIGASGAVDSVFLFSRCPVEEVETLVLDPHSRTSNFLAQILFAEKWKRSPRLVKTDVRDLTMIEGRQAAVLIGDQAHAVRGQFPYVYDLSAEWKHLTGLPFVFAVWAYRPGSIQSADLERIERAFLQGWNNRDQSAMRWGKEYGYSEQEAREYLMHRIQFNFDDAKHLAMERYFGYVHAFASISLAKS